MTGNTVGNGCGLSTDGFHCRVGRQASEILQVSKIYRSFLQSQFLQKINIHSFRWFSVKESTCQCRRQGVRSLGWEDPLQYKMATHSSILTWKIPWTEEPGELQSIGSQRVRHARVTEGPQAHTHRHTQTHTHTHTHTQTHTHMHTHTHSIWE